MFRNKYKYTKNHGLLPQKTVKPYHSPVTSLAILGSNSERQYELGVNPENQNIFMAYNDREYLHRECSMISQEGSPQIMKRLLKVNPLKGSTLTVYVTNDYKNCQQNLLGTNNQEEGWIQMLYQNLIQKKKEESSIFMNILGIENENDLIDLLVVDRPSEYNEYLPDYLKEQDFLKRRIRVSRQPQNHRYEAQNAFTSKIQTEEDLTKTLGRYQAIKGEIQTMKFVNAQWDWLQGELFILTEVSRDQQKEEFRVARRHYVLRVNQYLKSTSKLMLKLGMNIRKMQQRYSSLICDNNQSKLFRLLGQCFQKRKSIDRYHIYLVLQIGHYNTLKDEYQCLVPTSQLTTTKIGSKGQSSSFLYIKYYHDHSNLVTLLTKANKEKKQTKNIQQYLDECNHKAVKSRFPSNVPKKSYICDTFSSLEKKNIRNPYLSQQFSIQGRSAADLQDYIKQTAKLYKEEYSSRNKAESMSGVNRTTFKKSQNHPQHRMSLFQWSNKPVKIYKSRNEKGRLSQLDRRSAAYSKRIDTKETKKKSYSGYRIKNKKPVQKQSSKLLTSKEGNRSTTQIVDELVQKEILQLGKDDTLYQEEDMSDIQVLM